MPTPSSPTPFPSPFPALYLYPLNESFIPKHISLLHNQHVKIGRQTNAKTTPGERNGYFDSKVLSRQHAEVWEEGNKIYIKDVKSSNGTFINGERLSPEGLESEPYELKSDDIVEFGIDIVGEDNKTIVHHKVAARVVCILSEQDAQMAARAEQHQMQQLQQQQFGAPSLSPSPGSSGASIHAMGPGSSGPGSTAVNGSSFNFSGSNQQPPRRPQMSTQGISGMGGMGGSMRPPGKSGLTFDHILNRLQGELLKSRETGAELHTLTGAMNDIHDTLGGGNLHTTAPPFPHNLPPVRPAQASPQPEGLPVAPEQDAASNESSQPQGPATSQSFSSPALLSDLQTQLKDTQSSLSHHIDKIRMLEEALKEQEAIRNEVRLLRDMMDAVRVQRPEQVSASNNKPRRQLTIEPRGGFDIDEDDEREQEVLEDEFDDDDAQSIGTVVPHELERVEEEDEEEESEAAEPELALVDELEMPVQQPEGVPDSGPNGVHHRELDDVELDSQRQHHRPRTPEPSNLGMSRSKTLTSPTKSSLSDPNPTAVAVDALGTDSIALSSTLQTLQALQEQHSMAQSTISTLESKVEALERLVRETIGVQQGQPRPVPPAATASESEFEQDRKDFSQHLQFSPEEYESLTSLLLSWKKSVEGQWSSVREEWTQERERLSRAREEWESRNEGWDMRRGEWDDRKGEWDNRRAEWDNRREEWDGRRQEWDDKVRKVEDGLERIERMQKVQAPFKGNGDIGVERHGHGLVTPPSPRSLSSDSDRPRRRRSSSGRGRRHRRSSSRGADTDDTESTLASEEPVHLFEKTGGDKMASMSLSHSGVDHGQSQLPLTTSKRGSSGVPDLDTSLNGSGNASGGDSRRHFKDGERVLSAPRPPESGSKNGSNALDGIGNYNVQTAIGVLVLSVAAAAVVWRVKPDSA